MVLTPPPPPHFHVPMLATLDNDNFVSPMFDSSGIQIPNVLHGKAAFYRFGHCAQVPMDYRDLVSVIPNLNDTVYFIIRLSMYLYFVGVAKGYYTVYICILHVHIQ